MRGLVSALLLFLAGGARASTYTFSTFAGQVYDSGKVDGQIASARFHSPSGLAFDAAGNLWVADSENFCVRKITPAGVVSTIASIPVRSSRSWRINVDPSGRVFVAVDDIYQIWPDGGVSVFAKANAFGGFTFDPAGNLYVGNTNSVLKLSPSGEALAETKIPGANEYTPVLDVKRHPDGTLYVCLRTQIFRIGADGTPKVFAGPPAATGALANDPRHTFLGLSALSFDPAGRLLVADNSMLRTVDSDGTVTAIAGSWAIGHADGIGGAASFFQPSAFAFDSSGNLFVADTSNQTIRKGTPTSALSVPILLRIAQTQSQNAGAQSDVTLSAAADGTGLSYTWLKNGTAIPGATNDTLPLPRVSTVDEGAYTAVVANAAGSQSLAVGTLRVFNPPITAFTRRRYSANGRFLWGIVAGPDQLVAVGDAGAILTSSDGRNWTSRPSGTSNWLLGITYGNGRYIAVGDRGTILVSSDGATWTPAANSATSQRLNNVGFSAGTYIAVGEAGTIVLSTDAQHWNQSSALVSGWLRGLACNPKEQMIHRFHVGGQAGAMLVSPDGFSWDPISLTRDIDFESILLVGSLPVAIGSDGTGWYSRGTLIIDWEHGKVFDAWEKFSAGPRVRYRGLAVGANAIFAVGEQGTIVGAPHPSGPWVNIPSGTTSNLVAGAFFKDALFIVGENETILQSDPLFNGRLANISTRGIAGAGADMMTTGFVVSGSSPKQILLRAAGPALADFGVGGALAEPSLTLLDAAGRVMARNTAWSSSGSGADVAAATTKVGAFPFKAGSKDCALVATLSPGAYTAQVTAASGASGVALVEAYDVDTLSNEGPRTINLSTRGQVGATDRILIAGVVVDGSSSRRVLIRAVGPTLGTYGVSGVLARPEIRIIDNRGYTYLTAGPGEWRSGSNTELIRSTAKSAGAFALDESGDDAAIIATLLPGSWTIQVSGANGSTGAALVEVYEVP